MSTLQSPWASAEELKELKYRLERAKMNGDASAHLAEYRMQRILKLEAEVEDLKKQIASLVQR